MDESRTPFAIVAVSLAVSLLALAHTSLELRGERERMRTLVAEAGRAVAERDTIAAANALLLQSADSAAYYRDLAVSLRTRLAADSMSRTYDDYYLLIDTGQNRFHLRRGDLLVRSGYCGTGKGWTSNALGQTWDFSTPRGLRYVERTGENPYWYRPDWYWLEMNMRPPSDDQVVVIPQDLSYSEQIAYYNDSLTSSERVYVRAVPGVLGSYKIDLGGGVLLHYGSGRGSNVSHGCIRLGSADLEALYRTLPLGAPVLIY